MARDRIHKELPGYTAEWAAGDAWGNAINREDDEIRAEAAE